MGKLSIEEKAKAYDEALKRAKILYNDKNEIGYANAESVLEEVFPLLKESDDEMVRKCLINGMKFYYEDNEEATWGTEKFSMKVKDILAWLEKQAEQKPTLRERYKNIAESEWFKKTHDGMSVSNDEEPKWTDDDEKIRKWLIEYFKKINDEVACEDKKKIIAWLEKQGEQKLPIEKLPSEMKSIGESLGFTTQKECDEHNQMVSDLIMSGDNKVEPKFHKGDWVFIEEVKGYKNGPFQIKTVDSFGYNFDEYHIIPFMYEELLSKWTIQDARPGDVLTNGDFPCIFKRCDGNGSLYVYCGINAHNDFSILSEDPENVWDDYSKQYFPATKEQRDLLFQKMHEAGYEWDADEKELKKIEQKSQRMVSAEAKEAMYDKPACAWSEKDENVLEDIKEAIINYWDGDTQDILLDWLKSLKERCTWKPSLAQMNALSIVSKGNAPDDMEAIVSLYNDLKKL